MQNLSKMALSLKVLFCLVLLLVSSLTLKCEASHFDLIGNDDLKKENQLNRTFTLVQGKMEPLANVTYSPTKQVTYTLYNIKTTLTFIDEQQRGIILGNDTIVIYGGKLKADITFSWTKNYPITLNGTGSAVGISTFMDYVKQISINTDNSYSYKLLDYLQIGWIGQGQFVVSKIAPADTSDDDKLTITKMMNYISGISTLSSLLGDEIDRLYPYYLNFVTQGQTYPVKEQFDYVWAPDNGKPNVTIAMKSRSSIQGSANRDGIKSMFDIQAEGATNWRCGKRAVPNNTLDFNFYGHTQQFISYDFYENMIRHAIQKGFLDATLDRQNWETSMFHFLAGDLYEVLPALQAKYEPLTQITGRCNASSIGLKVYKADKDTFNVTIHFDCDLKVEREKIIDFTVGLEAEVAGHPQTATLDFKLRSHEDYSQFYQYRQYKIQNLKLADLMVKSALKRLYNGNLFGSGWPLSPPKDQPHFIAENNYTVVYDPTHQDPDNRVKSNLVVA